MSDPSTQWTELSERYRSLADDELESLAAEAYDLTDIAREVLQAEITSRHLNVKLNTTAPERDEEREEQDAVADNPEFDPANFTLVEVHRCWDAAEAHIAKDILDNSRIPSWFGPDNLERVDDYRGSYERGVLLRVCEEDRQRAMAAFAQHWPKDESTVKAEMPSQSEEEQATQLVCPKCHSPEIVFESLDKDSPDADDLYAKYNWHCDACGNDWQDDGVEKEVSNPN